VNRQPGSPDADQRRNQDLARLKSFSEQERQHGDENETRSPGDIDDGIVPGEKRRPEDGG
jgi:hypothetical protein